MIPSDIFDDLINHCNTRAFYAYGTMCIFERRCQNLRVKRNAITFLGIGVPLLIGSLILSFGEKTEWIPIVIPIAASVGVIQLILSLWSIISRWDEQYSYAIASMQANTRLYNSWTRLSKGHESNFQDLVRELDKEDERQEETDMAAHISVKEKRFAMRSTLFYKGVSCVTCEVKPTSMKPSKCDTCGNF